MRILRFTFVLIWLVVSALPALAAFDHAACCKNCTNGYCLMDKDYGKSESQTKPQCHHVEKKNQMRSAGCRHESALKAFFFDATLPEPTLSSAIHYQKNLPTIHSFGLMDLSQILTPPPRTLLL